MHSGPQIREYTLSYHHLLTTVFCMGNESATPFRQICHPAALSRSCFLLLSPAALFLSLQVGQVSSTISYLSLMWRLCQVRPPHPPASFSHPLSPSLPRWHPLASLMIVSSFTNSGQSNTSFVDKPSILVANGNCTALFICLNLSVPVPFV